MVARSPLDPLRTILSGLAKRLGLEPRLLELRLQHRWREMLGEPIASHTWPDQIRFKKLYLVVRNSVWLQQLTFLKPTLLAKINAEAGTELITEIVLRVGEIPNAAGSTGRSQERREPPAADPELSAEIASHTGTIQDPAIREGLTAVIGRCLSQPQPPLPPGGGPSRVP